MFGGHFEGVFGGDWGCFLGGIWKCFGAIFLYFERFSGGKDKETITYQ